MSHCLLLWHKTPSNDCFIYNHDPSLFQPPVPVFAITMHSGFASVHAQNHPNVQYFWGFLWTLTKMRFGQ